MKTSCKKQQLQGLRCGPLGLARLHRLPTPRKRIACCIRKRWRKFDESPEPLGVAWCPKLRSKPTNRAMYIYIYIFIYIYILFVCEGMTFAWPLYMWFKGIVNINRDVKSVITMNHCGSGVFKQWQCGISPCHCDLFSQVRSHFHRLNSLCTYFCLKKPWTLRFWLLTLQIFVHSNSGCFPNPWVFSGWISL